MIEANVVASAGTVHYLTLEEIRRCIREAGWEPRQRNVFYQLIDDPLGVSRAARRETASGSPGSLPVLN
jgi:cyclic dehypoxanthinyl futalosine synthase